MDMSNASIGSRIREIREQRGYTREQLAEYAEISANFVWEIETGRKSMKAQVLGRISAALDVPTDYLLFGEISYKPNAKINSIVSAQPAEVQKQIEKMITVFLETLSIKEKLNSDDDNSESDNK